MSAVIGPADRAGDTAVKTDLSDPLANRLLASLSHIDFAKIRSSLKLVELDQGVVLHHPGDEVEQVYFPHTGMVSLLAVMKDGRAIETATVGHEGVVGGMAGLGLHNAFTRATVQLPLIASQIAAAQFRKAVQSSEAFRNLVVRSDDALLAQVQVTAACNALHPIEARLARWILQSSDRMIGNGIPLTQELLSQMLGVTRSSVSEVAGKLQSTGFIRYSRGNIEILDRKALMGAACECYETIRDKTAQVVP
jgi:CRP-like cAMP-binding protein